MFEVELTERWRPCVHSCENSLLTGHMGLLSCVLAKTFSLCTTAVLCDCFSTRFGHAVVLTPSPSTLPFQLQQWKRDTIQSLFMVPCFQEHACARPAMKESGKKGRDFGRNTNKLNLPKMHYFKFWTISRSSDSWLLNTLGWQHWNKYPCTSAKHLSMMWEDSN